MHVQECDKDCHGNGKCVPGDGSDQCVCYPGYHGDDCSLSYGVNYCLRTPCEGNQAIFVYPDAFRTFLLKASKELGSPLRPTISWRDYSST